MPRISPSYSSVSAIGPTLGYCPVMTSPTPIEHGSGNANGGDMWYVIVLFGPCAPYLFIVCYSSEATVRPLAPTTVRPSTPVLSPSSAPSALSQPTPSTPSNPHSAVLKSTIPVPPRVCGLRRKFVDDGEIWDRSINVARRAPHIPCAYHLIVVHIRH
jgi:hypothetical protein